MEGKTVEERTYYWYRTPIGFVTIAADEMGVYRIAFGCTDIPGAVKVARQTTTTAAGQILEYLAGKRRIFELPLSLSGSAFQRDVWTALRDVPYGESITASDLAAELGVPGAQRSIGAVLRVNPIALIIPDHRVVTATGKPFGTGLDATRRARLLAFERSRL